MQVADYNVRQEMQRHSVQPTNNKALISLSSVGSPYSNHVKMNGISSPSDQMMNTAGKESAAPVNSTIDKPMICGNCRALQAKQSTKDGTNANSNPESSPLQRQKTTFADIFKALRKNNDLVMHECEHCNNVMSEEDMYFFKHDKERGY